MFVNVSTSIVLMQRGPAETLAFVSVDNASTNSSIQIDEVLIYERRGSAATSTSTPIAARRFNGGGGKRAPATLRCIVRGGIGSLKAASVGDDGCIELPPPTLTLAVPLLTIDSDNGGNASASVDVQCVLKVTRLPQTNVVRKQVATSPPSTAAAHEEWRVAADAHIRRLAQQASLAVEPAPALSTASAAAAAAGKASKASKARCKKRPRDADVDVDVDVDADVAEARNLPSSQTSSSAVSAVTGGRKRARTSRV
jgi:hypothetical protein